MKPLFNEALQRISKEEVEALYLELNLTKEELQINLNTELILLIQTKLERYGSNNPKYIFTDSIVFARNPNKYREYEECSIGHIYGAGSKKYI